LDDIVVVEYIPGAVAACVVEDNGSVLVCTNVVVAIGVVVAICWVVVANLVVVGGCVVVGK
jgi:hypothetical protein